MRFLNSLRPKCACGGAPVDFLACDGKTTITTSFPKANNLHLLLFRFLALIFGRSASVFVQL